MMNFNQTLYKALDGDENALDLIDSAIERGITHDFYNDHPFRIDDNELQAIVGVTQTIPSNPHALHLLCLALVRDPAPLSGNYFKELFASLNEKLALLEIIEPEEAFYLKAVAWPLSKLITRDNLFNQASAVPKNNNLDPDIGRTLSSSNLRG